MVETEEGKRVISPAMVGEAVTGMLSTISQIIGYFQVNYEIKGQVFSIESQALQAMVASQLDKEFDVYIDNFGVVSSSELVNSFNNLITLKGQLDDESHKMTKILEKNNESLANTKNKLAKLQSSTTSKTVESAGDNIPNNDVEKQGFRGLHIKELNGKIEATKIAITNSQDLVKSIAAFAESITKSADEKSLPGLSKSCCYANKYIP